MKREILNFSKEISEGVDNSTTKFVMNIQYELAKGGKLSKFKHCNKFRWRYKIKLHNR